MGVHSFVKNACLFLALATGGSQAIRIIQSNDDGWAEMNLRAFHDVLIQAGHDAVVSSPAEDMSGKGKYFIFPPPCPQNQGHVHELCARLRNEHRKFHCLVDNLLTP